jgi:hypothetical protein
MDCSSTYNHSLEQGVALGVNAGITITQIVIFVRLACCNSDSSLLPN